MKQLIDQGSVLIGHECISCLGIKLSPVMRAPGSDGKVETVSRYGPIACTGT